MIKKYFEFIKENLNKSKSILKSKMDDYEKIKTFLTSNNSIGYMGKFTELLFNGVPYSEIINLYNSIVDLKKKNIKINIDDFNKYEDILDDISRKQILYKFKSIYNKFPKEQKEMISIENKDDVLLLSKLYDVEHDAFISKVSRYKSADDLISSAERFLSGKIKSFDKEYVKSLLDDNLKLCFESENLLIVRTFTHDAIVKVGSDTSWCIVSSKSTFLRYIEKGSSQYVLFDYTKDKYDVDFKIGFTLDSNFKISYAHDVLDKSVKSYMNDLIDKNNIETSSLFLLTTEKVDPGKLDSKSTLVEIEDIIRTLDVKVDGEVVSKLVSILSSKFSKSKSEHGFIFDLIKKLFSKLKGKDNIVHLEDFDKYKKEMGTQYSRIKNRLSEIGVLLSNIPPTDIFRNIPLMLKYYKNWKHEVEDMKYYVQCIDTDNRIAEPILHFVNNSTNNKDNKILGQYCTMLINKNFDIDKMKVFIDKLVTTNDPKIYYYYNLFGIPYKFNVKKISSMKLDNVIQEDTILENMSKYDLGRAMEVLKNSDVTLKYTQDKFLEIINSDYKWLDNKIILKSSIYDKSFDTIVQPVIDKLSYSKKVFYFSPDISFPIEYSTNLAYRANYSTHRKSIKVIIT